VFEETKRIFDILCTEDLTGYTSLELFKRLGLAFKIFIKQELHPKKKVMENRHRLIFSSPVVLTILEKMVFGAQNKTDIENFSKVPSKPGVPFTSEGCLSLYEYVKNRIPNPVSTDQSGWDWHVQPWLIDADLETRLLLLPDDMSQPNKDLWYQIARNLNHIIKYKTVVFSDGAVVFQSEPGIWPSGSLRTSGTNSRMRAILRRLAQGDWRSMTMGDDAVETRSDDLVESYRLLGFELKPPEHVSSEAFEFCSKWFIQAKWVIPTNTSYRKMILNYLVKQGWKSDDLRLGLRTEFRNLSPDLLQEVIHRLSLPERAPNNLGVAPTLGELDENPFWHGVIKVNPFSDGVGPSTTQNSSEC